MIAVSIYCYVIKHRVKQKHDSKDEFLKNDAKIRTCYYFHGIIKTEEFNLDNVSIDEESYENIYLYYLWLILNLCVLGSIK